MADLHHTLAWLHARLGNLRGEHRDRGEIVTWVILAAGMAVIAVSVVLLVGAKLRARAAGIQLQ
jgi:hypothetical protein